MKKRTLQRKLILVFICTSVFVLIADLLIYDQINKKIEQINEVYRSNVNINGMSDQLEQVQQYVYQYLNTKSSDSLESYYQAAQHYQDASRQLNHQITDHKLQLMEKNIAGISEYYLQVAEETVQAKRGRNIEKYKTSYAELAQIFQYLQDYLISLNNLQFKDNANEYRILQSSLRTMEWLSILILAALIALMTVIIILITRQLTKPLMQLAATADQVTKGDFNITVVKVHTQDEIETLSRAFHTMILSIKDSITKLKQSMELENQMRAKELLMENHLKDAQLKYLQAQINPHFLFNTLNAGVQLAMMENAARTSVYIENVAAFFRYNLLDISQDTTINEEIMLVDHYLHILNVRFTDEIDYEKELDDSLLSCQMPRMILQPLVENAFLHGLRGMERRGKITLTVIPQKQTASVSITDNGSGMTSDQIRQLLAGKETPPQSLSCSNGVGFANVIGRLRLYYDQEDIIEVVSKEQVGTTITIKIPLRGGVNVSHFNRR